jgi:hypothetical protein
MVETLISPHFCSSDTYGDAVCPRFLHDWSEQYRFVRVCTEDGGEANLRGVDGWYVVCAHEPRFRSAEVLVQQLVDWQPVHDLSAQVPHRLLCGCLP